MQVVRQRIPTASVPSRVRWLPVVMAAFLVTGCSTLEEDKVDYRSARQGNLLEVPPDLSQLSRENRYVVPGSTVTASGYQTSQSTQTAPVVASNQAGDVRVERSGNQRWLVVDRPPEAIWSAVRDFWQENGFLLVQDQQALGILETDWAENRAKLPQDFIRSTLGRVFDSLYSTGERDKFRTRLERTTGGTEIFISHRGMVEVYSTQEKDSTIWQPRPADPELETEFLRRLMIKLGVSQEQARAQAGRPAPQTTSRIDTVNNRPVLVISEDFDRAWRRVGLALDRTGFTVEDRDRSQGTYFVRYVAPQAPQGKEPGFFGRLLGRSAPPQPEPVRYRVTVREAQGNTTVTVLNADGQPDASANAQRIVQVLADDLK